MANVKISDLPSLTTGLSNSDVIIVNDATDNTTKKLAVSNAYPQLSLTLDLPANTSLANGDTSFTATVTPISSKLAIIKFPNLSITNNSSSPVPLIFTKKASTFSSASITTPFMMRIGSSLNNCTYNATTATNIGNLCFSGRYDDTTICLMNFSCNNETKNVSPHIVELNANSSTTISNATILSTITLP